MFLETSYVHILASREQSAVQLFLQTLQHMPLKIHDIK